MKLLCTGDLHLGAGADLGRQPGDRLRDQADVLAQIGGLAVGRDVDGILIAGDVFEGPGIPPEQLDVFARFVEGCAHADVPLLACTGNGRHDAAVRETNGLAIFNHIDGIRVHSQPRFVEFVGCAVAVLPWVSPARLVAARGRDIPRDQINEEVAGLLVDIAAELYADMEPLAPRGKPRLLLAHWSVSGAALPTGLPVDQLREPVIPNADLGAIGFDHVVLGHIHKPQTVGEHGFYVGSPMPLNFGEAATEHGVCILHVGETEEIDFPGAEFVPIDSRPLITLDFDHDDPVAQIALSSHIGWDIPDGAIVRVRYQATAEQQRHLDTGALRRELLDAGASVVRIQPDIVRAQRARVQGLDEQADELVALEQWLDATDYQGDRERLRSRAALYLGAAT